MRSTYLVLSVVVSGGCVVHCAVMIRVTVVPVQVSLCCFLLSSLQCLLVRSAGRVLESCV